MASVVIWKVLCNGEIKHFSDITRKLQSVSFYNTTLEAVCDSSVPFAAMFVS